MRWDVHYVAETGSTNTDLLALARAGAAPGRVLRAGHQTAGRGRLGRVWQAPPGASLLCSILLRWPPEGAGGGPAGEGPFWAVARVALAASDACRALCGVDVRLKWPNDLFLLDRKLGGILAEADPGSGLLVVGLGLNVAWPPTEELPEDLRPILTALSHHVARPPTPEALLDALLAALDGWLERDPATTRAAYEARSATLGAPVRVATGTGVLEGPAVGLGPDGELLVEGPDGTTTVRVGDITALPRR